MAHESLCIHKSLMIHVWTSFNFLLKFAIHVRERVINRVRADPGRLRYHAKKSPLTQRQRKAVVNLLSSPP